jgi:hypothetical protein
MAAVFPVVVVECDRCRRPGWSITVSEVTGAVVLDGARIGDDLRALPVMAGGRPHRYAGGGGRRAGAFILAAHAPGGMPGDREKLVCVGRRHPRYERVVTASRVARAYLEAGRAGRSRIGMRDI